MSDFHGPTSTEAAPAPEAGKGGALRAELSAWRKRGILPVAAGISLVFVAAAAAVVVTGSVGAEQAAVTRASVTLDKGPVKGCQWDSGRQRVLVAARLSAMTTAPVTFSVRAGVRDQSKPDAKGFERTFTRVVDGPADAHLVIPVRVPARAHAAGADDCWVSMTYARD